jgi:Flp pilus assembly protein TadG
MKKIVISSVLALLLLLVFSLPSMAQETANVTATTTEAANATTAVATTTNATTNATTTAAGVTSFLQAANNTTAPPVPGFEAIFAVAGILCIALILKRK